MDPPPELEGYAAIDGLEEGQQIILGLPNDGVADSDSVIMEVVSMDGNQIHFIAPDKFSMGDVRLGGKYAVSEDDNKYTLAGVDGSGDTVKFSIDDADEAEATEITLSEVDADGYGTAVMTSSETGDGAEEVDEIRLPDVASLHDDGSVAAGDEVGEREETVKREGVEVAEDGGERGTELCSSLSPADDVARAEEEEGELEEVPTPTCFLCRRPSLVVTYVLRGRTTSSCCYLAERLSSCLAPVKISYCAADAVCGNCEALINTADAHFHQYQLSSRELSALLTQGADTHPSIQPKPAEVVAESETEATPPAPPPPPRQQRPLLVPANYRPKRRKPSPRGDGEDSADSDWTPSRDGSPPRTGRGRRPKARCVWSPEPVVKQPARGRGRPRKHPLVQPQPTPRSQAKVEVKDTPSASMPTVIEYSNLESLKQLVNDTKAEKASSSLTSTALKSDLEKIIHLEVRAVEELPGADDPATEAEDAEDDAEEEEVLQSQRPPRTGAAVANRSKNIYECRRCDLQFQDSDEMVKHLRQHASKPWCKRCRTEFPNRTALLDHRKACRLQHRAGFCSMCDREVPYHRFHMKRHAEMVAEGELQEGEPLPDNEDEYVPPALHRSSGKYLAGGICSICGEHVPNRLRKHERSHSATNTCPICKKVFARDDVVRGHISRVHLKERPYVCSQCGKTFVSVYSLQRHEMIHNNEYRFYCQECGDGFRQKQQLTSHMRHKHGVVDVVFEDVQVMPEGTAVVDALDVVANPDLTAGVLEALGDKDDFVIATAASGDDEGETVRYTVTDTAGRIYRVAAADADSLAHD